MKALKGVVILMTLTIAVLMTLIAYGMYQKSQDPEFKFFDLSGGSKSAAATENAVVEAPAGSSIPRAFGDISLPLPAGAQITSATVSANRLIIITSETQKDAPNAEQVWVIDLATGQILGRVKAQGTP